MSQLNNTTKKRHFKHLNERHWEMDCIVGKRGERGATLLVPTERSTRQEIIHKMPDKTQVSVKKEIDKLERKYGKNFSKRFKTITVDNGPEFLNSTELETSILDSKNKRFRLYYAHPYSSWERGLNENANRLIRRFIPKGTDIEEYLVIELQTKWLLKTGFCKNM